ncbi:MAG TPA: response regulator [Nannocystaceae bacterium]|nr:response regulator [Nannocystaceae bacterium]
MRVLIVDDEVNVRFAIERALRKVGMETGSATTVRHAIDRLRNEAYDAVVTDLRLPGGDGTQLVQWIGSYSPSTRVVIASAQIPDEVRATYGRSDGIRVVDKPIDSDALVVLLEEFGPRRGFYGNAIEVELFDYVQMIALSGRDKLIEVQTSGGKGLIWFEHGDVVHCEFDQFRGELAFYKMLALNRGTFKEAFFSKPPRRTVTRSSTHMLIEAARQADEGILGEVDVGAPGHIRDEGSMSALAYTPPTLAQTVAEPSSDDLEGAFEEFEDLEVEDDAATNETAVPTPHVPEPAPAHHGFDEPTHRFPRGRTQPRVTAAPPIVGGAPLPSSALAILDSESSSPSAEDSAAMSTAAGHAIFDDPDTRSVMLDQFWQFEGINGVAIISSTGKVLAEDMRANSSLVTLAGFYMRGAARIARTLGFNVFDGVVARSVNGQQMVMVSMGAASAVLSVAPGADPEAVRDAVMGVE